MTEKLLLPDVKKLFAKAEKDGLLSIDPKIVQQIIEQYPKEYLRWTVTRNFPKN